MSKRKRNAQRLSELSKPRPENFSEITFRGKLSGEGRWPNTLEELVEGWITYTSRQKVTTDDHFWAFEAACDLGSDYPAWCLKFILAVLDRNPPENIVANLAAGPLEHVLATHGEKFIDWIEDKARRSPEFRHLLGGVWQNRMSDEIWQRVTRAAVTRW